MTGKYLLDTFYLLITLKASQQSRYKTSRWSKANRGSWHWPGIEFKFSPKWRREGLNPRLFDFILFFESIHRPEWTPIDIFITLLRYIFTDLGCEMVTKEIQVTISWATNYYILRSQSWWFFSNLRDFQLDLDSSFRGTEFLRNLYFVNNYQTSSIENND